MPKHARVTSPAHPWRRTARTIFAGIVAAASMADAVYAAATRHDPAAATGYAATGLDVAAAVTRVMALPVVETFLQRFLPFLAAGDVAAERVLALTADSDHGKVVVAGDAAPHPTGSVLPPSETVRQLTAAG